MDPLRADSNHTLFYVIGWGEGVGGAEMTVSEKQTKLESREEETRKRMCGCYRGRGKEESE
jgi:hypothetical protein